MSVEFASELLAVFAAISCGITLFLLIVGGVVLFVDGIERNFLSFFGGLGLIIVAVIIIIAMVILTIESNRKKVIPQIVTLKLIEPTTKTTVHYDDQDYVLFINDERRTVSAKTYHLYDMGDTIGDYFIEVEDIEIDMEPNSVLEIPKNK